MTLAAQNVPTCELDAPRNLAVLALIFALADCPQCVTVGDVLSFDQRHLPSLADAEI